MSLAYKNFIMRQIIRVQFVTNAQTDVTPKSYSVFVHLEDGSMHEMTTTQNFEEAEAIWEIWENMRGTEFTAD